MAPVPNIKLNSGYEMPQVGFGLWKVDNAVASDVVYNAIKAGYRLFDGACGTLQVEKGKTKNLPRPLFHYTRFPSPTKMFSQPQRGRGPRQYAIFSEPPSSLPAP